MMCKQENSGYLSRPLLIHTEQPPVACSDQSIKLLASKWDVIFFFYVCTPIWKKKKHVPFCWDNHFDYGLRQSLYMKSHQIINNRMWVLLNRQQVKNIKNAFQTSQRTKFPSLNAKKPMIRYHISHKHLTLTQANWIYPNFSYCESYLTRKKNYQRN